MEVTSTPSLSAVLFGVALAGVSPAAQAQGPNLFNNPSFESADGNGRVDGGWYDFASGADNLDQVADPSVGTFAVEASDGGNGNGVQVVQSVSGLTAGTDYTLSADMKVSTAGTVNLKMNFKDGNGADIPFPGAGTAYPAKQVNPDGTYQNFTYTLTAPPGAVGGQFLVEYFGTGSMTVDNAVFQTSAPPPPFCPGNLLTNGTVQSDLTGYNYAYGGTVFDASGGPASDGAIDVDGTGATPATAGVGQQDVAVDPAATAYQFLFDVRNVASGAYQQLKFTTKNGSGANVVQEEVSIRNTAFVTRRLVVPTTGNPATIGFTLDIGAGDRTVLDNMCITPTTITPPPGVTGNLLADGTVENGSPLPNGGGWDPTNDPATGLQSLATTNPGYASNRSDEIAVTAGTQYELGLSAKRTGDYQFVKANFQFVDGAGANVGSRIDNNIPAAADFQRSTFFVTAPAGATGVTIQLEAGGNAGGYAAVDDFVFGEVGVVPVVLAALDAAAEADVNVVRWTTASEVNTAAFLVERSADGQSDWTLVAEVAPRGGASVATDYEARDASPIANAYYRLRSVDFDGAQETSQVLNVTRAGTRGGLRAYPNPAFAELTVAGDFEAGDYRVVDVTGRTIAAGLIPEGAARITVNTGDLPAGQYYVRIGTETLRFVR